MAEDVLERCAQEALLEKRPKGVTTHLKLIGADMPKGVFQSICQPPGLHSYGSEQAAVLDMPGARTELCPGLTEGMVRFAARFEYAVKVEDVLARRSRLLFLDARLAADLAQAVGDILRHETGLDPEVKAFTVLAQRYLLLP
jgi:glycerol-3-phosphate dehydrogenase